LDFLDRPRLVAYAGEGFDNLLDCYQIAVIGDHGAIRRQINCVTDDTGYPTQLALDDAFTTRSRHAQVPHPDLFDLIRSWRRLAG
jgi:hypothetical protein